MEPGAAQSANPYKGRLFADLEYHFETLRALALLGHKENILV